MLRNVFAIFALLAMSKYMKDNINISLRFIQKRKVYLSVHAFSFYLFV